MRYELRLHRVTFGILAVVLMAFVAFLFYIRPSLADERLEVIASLAIVIVAAAAFVAMGMIEGIMVFYFGKQHKREVLCYLLLGLLSLVSGLYLSISETTSFQTVSLVAAPHALLFGVAELRLAQHLERHPGYRRALFGCGLVEIALGFILIGGSELTPEGTATLLVYVAILSILQLLPFLFYSRTAVPR
jgi:drug/metabolite transporter (DMT)-like permease